LELVEWERRPEYKFLKNGQRVKSLLGGGQKLTAAAAQVFRKKNI
jgi:hypothetical protein